ncbi:hypothetical protein GOBAR_DD31195 [Gossypium barbadense]|nr:hypothetical protein GOBAR_DD31195 [Gossypium barbadense]
MNAWLPQASYPCGNFSGTSTFKFRRSKGSIGHAFMVRIRTGNQNQTSFYPFVPHEISVLVELILGHLRYLLTDVPPQPNHAFMVRIHTGNQNQTRFYPFVPHEISVLVELILGHLRYLLTDVPPQPNSQPDNVFHPDWPAEAGLRINQVAFLRDVGTHSPQYAA